jgi:hypothetical protein
MVASSTVPDPDPTPATAHAESESPTAALAPATADAAAETSLPPSRGQGKSRRNNMVDRRTGMERRQLSRDQSDYSGPERRTGIDRRTGLERRRGPGRRRSDERRAAEEGEMTAEQFEFVMAIEMYKKVNKRLYPTWTEILEVMHQLGYRKVLAREIELDNVPEPELVATGTEE